MSKGLKLLLLNSLLILFVFSCAGFAADWLYSKWVTTSESGFMESMTCNKRSPTLIGGNLKANCKGRWLKKFGPDTFDIEFSSDEFGRRIIFDKIKKSASDSGQIFFFGGSDIFGTGVNDHDTLANQFLNISDFLNAHNYGGYGYGPQQTLELLDSTDLTKEAPPDKKRNVMLFFFGDNHVERAAGVWPIATEWGANYPYYVLDGHDQLIFKGTFASGGRYSSWQLLAKKSRLLNDLVANASTYFSFSDADIRLTAKMIAAAKSKFFAQYSNAQFFVVFSPITSNSGKKMKEYLTEMGVQILDYSKLWNPEDPNNHIPEGHYSPAAYHTIAEQLAKDLKNSP